MRTVLTIITALLFLFLVQTPFAFALNVFGIAELDQYFAKNGRGLIQPNESRETKSLQADMKNDEDLVSASDLQFSVDDKMGTILSVNSFNVKRNQALYVFEPKNVMDLFPAKDFLTSHTKLFESFEYDEASFRYKNPFLYLDSWGSLPHPPLRTLEEKNDYYINILKPVTSRKDLNPAYMSADLQKEVDDYSNTELTKGNHLNLLANGYSYDEKVKLIRNAKKYVFFTTMFIACDRGTEGLIQALIDKAKEGVDVRVSLENFYRVLFLHKCMNRLERGGVKVTGIRDMFKTKGFSHSKFITRDGEEAILGGENMVRPETAADGFNFKNRDTDLYVRGPMVADLEDEFLKVWKRHARKKSLKRFPIDDYIANVKETKEAQRDAHVRGRDNYSNWYTHQEGMNGVCRVLQQDPIKSKATIFGITNRYLQVAKDSAFFTTPGVTYDKRVIRKKYAVADLFQTLREKEKAGLVSYVVMPDVNSCAGEISMVIREWSQHLYAKGKFGLAKKVKRFMELLDFKAFRGGISAVNFLHEGTGIHFYQYFNYIHAKETMFDRVMVSVGSPNLDDHSSHQYETSAFCFDNHLAEQTENQMVLDLVNSIPTHFEKEMVETRAHEKYNEKDDNLNPEIEEIETEIDKMDDEDEKFELKRLLESARTVPVVVPTAKTEETAAGKLLPSVMPEDLRVEISRDAER